MNGHNDVMRLLLDKGANVNSIDKVSEMIWEIVIIVCVSDCSTVIMVVSLLCLQVNDTTSASVILTQYDCGLVIYYFNYHSVQYQY